ncbi:C40 family peptidase [Streptomyces sp. NBC_01239]|uniref:C40 family peptidase n=1 Tax=Streptomyces sp. NBC_01239 TaxID=2903792 RepID=UPI0022598481|nr:C40 family peptidase [Streptomyces sp. NBC_01239]MCX4813234.1 C40 family peptidase [Streptomyces sp. NBC_01239]
MASSHRKPRSTGKRIAGNPGLGEVEKKVDDLYRRAESATEKYNATRERAARPRKRVDSLLDDVTERAQRPNSAREWLGSFAVAQYRTGVSAPDASAFQLADIPPDHFEQTQLMSRPAMRRRDAGDAYTTGQSATGSPAVPADTHSDLGTAKATVQKKLATARELLAQLTAQKQQQAAPQADPAKGIPSDASYATKAAKAVAFARAQVGKPYVWGATGPGSYDCSGLTQAAWKATGVTLPRATTDQADAGTTVPLTDAQPGDLVFFHDFHDDISHVGVYAGDGMMIHAPKPGAYVREESVHHDGTAIVHSVVRPA